MEAFYVSIVFLGILLVIGSLFFIIMDKVNGKDFFKEFDRKKEEMFNLIQDSEEMVQELNRMSDYVVSVVAEKNQEFFKKSLNVKLNETTIDKEEASIQQALILPSVQDVNQNEIPVDTVSQYKEPFIQKSANTQFPDNSEMYNKDVSDIGKNRLVLNSRRREVLQMIEQGLSNDEISDKLKIGKGEIGLIRGLSR